MEVVGLVDMDLRYFPKKQKAPENPLRLSADRQSAIQCRNDIVYYINRSLKS